eukprot:2931491-Amphidinium_carterae.1
MEVQGAVHCCTAFRNDVANNFWVGKPSQMTAWRGHWQKLQKGTRHGLCNAALVHERLLDKRAALTTTRVPAANPKRSDSCHGQVTVASAKAA